MVKERKELTQRAQKGDTEGAATAILRGGMLLSEWRLGKNLFRRTGENRAETRRNAAKGVKKSSKIRLTENGECKILPVAPVTAFPRSTFRRSSPIRTPDKVSEEYWCR